MRRIHSILALSAVALGLALTATVIWWSSRGHGLIDESLYLTMIDKPAAGIRFPSAFHVLLNPLWELSGESIPRWRLLRAAVDIGVDVVFATTLVRWVHHHYPQSAMGQVWPRVAAVASITVAGFGTWAWAPNGIGYNELASILLTMLATLLIVLAWDDCARSKVVAASVATGALLFLMLLVRYTAMAGFVLALSAVLVHRRGVAGALRIAPFIASGAAAAAVFVHLAIFDLGQILVGIVESTSEAAQGTHGPVALLGTHLLSTAEALVDGLRYGGPFIVVLAIFTFAEQRVGASDDPDLERPTMRHPQPAAIAIAAVVAGALLLIRTPITGVEKSLMAINTWAFNALLLGLWIVVQGVRSSLSNAGVRSVSSVWTLAAALVAIPVMFSFGTANPLYLNAISLAPLWFGATIIAMSPAATRDRFSRGAVVGLSILTFSVSILAYAGITTTLFGPNGSQDTRVTAGRFEGLLLDSETARFVGELETLRGQLDDDPTVISFWRRPAVPFALDGEGIGFPWYSNFSKDADSALMAGACRADGAPTGQIVLVTEETDPEEFGPFREALAECGIAYPGGFEHMTQLTEANGQTLDVFVARR